MHQWLVIRLSFKESMWLNLSKPALWLTHCSTQFDTKHVRQRILRRCTRIYLLVPSFFLPLQHKSGQSSDIYSPNSSPLLPPPLFGKSNCSVAIRGKFAGELNSLIFCAFPAQRYVRGNWSPPGPELICISKAGTDYYLFRGLFAQALVCCSLFLFFLYEI